MFIRQEMTEWMNTNKHKNNYTVASAEKCLYTALSIIRYDQES